MDKVGEALGIGSDDQRRAAAAVESALYDLLDRNHTLIKERDIAAGVAKLLNSAATSADPNATRPIDAAVASGGACRLSNGVQPFGAALMEETIARKIAAAVNKAPYHDLVIKKVDAGDLDTRIENFAHNQQNLLTNMQKEAIRIAHTNRIALLAGYAGSGKTTSLRGICDIADALGHRVHLMALSGRAAQRMSISTGRPSRTIASFLQAVTGADGASIAPGAMVIIDEASMLDLPTLWRIMKVLGDANLLLVGDPAQLPPIGFGLTFHILCEAERVPSVVLDRVMRQSVETGIPAVAEAVRNGQDPLMTPFAGLSTGVSFVDCSSDEAFDTITDVGRQLKADGAELGETQIIAPVKSRPAGIEAINRRFHQARQSATEGDYFPGRRDLAAGDPIMWTQNDWERELMNGSMGRLHSVIDGIAHATLDGAPLELSLKDANFLALAYAISVHKSQGSQWRRVIIPVFKSRILDRTLIYTAITRASEQVIIVGDRTAFNQAVRDMPKSLRRSVGLGIRLQRQSFGSQP